MDLASPAKRGTNRSSTVDRRLSDRSLALSQERCELQPESGILNSNGLVAAQQESNESKDGQKDDWHGSRLFVSIPLQVNPLQPDRIMAKHSLYHGGLLVHRFYFVCESCGYDREGPR